MSICVPRYGEGAEDQPPASATSGQALGEWGAQLCLLQENGERAWGASKDFAPQPGSGHRLGHMNTAMFRVTNKT